VIQVLQPWRVADSISLPSYKHAKIAARSISRASGFRARITALRNYKAVENVCTDEEVQDTPLLESLDSLTYVPVEFSKPKHPDNKVLVRALVDTGSSSSDLQGRFIKQLQLPVACGGSMFFETAAGKTVQSAMYETQICVLGRTAAVTISPAEEDSDAADSEDDEADDDNGDDSSNGTNSQADEIDREFGFEKNTDEALLGSETLAALELVLDCRNRCLLAGPAHGIGELRFLNRSPTVTIEFQNPLDPTKKISVNALVDSGSTDCDLQEHFIKALNLPVDEIAGTAKFETAAGLTIEAPIYHAIVRLLGREKLVRVSPSADPDGSDEALLGHDALAALGVLVDSRNRRLIPAPEF